jgi:predicted extracellular nuclease
MATAVYEIRTVETVMRTYTVEIEHHPLEAEEDAKARAEEEIYSGNQVKFTEGDAHIDEVLSVERRAE